MDRRSAEELVHLGRIWTAADIWRARRNAVVEQIKANPDVIDDLLPELWDATHTWMSLLSVMLRDYAKGEFQIPCVDELMLRDDADRLMRIMDIGDDDAWLRELPSIYEWSLVIHHALGKAVRTAAKHITQN